MTDDLKVSKRNLQLRKLEVLADILEAKHAEFKRPEAFVYYF